MLGLFCNNKHLRACSKCSTECTLSCAFPTHSGYARIIDCHVRLRRMTSFLNKPIKRLKAQQLEVAWEKLTTASKEFNYPIARMRALVYLEV